MIVVTSHLSVQIVHACAMTGIQICYQTSSSQKTPTKPQECIVSRCTYVHSTTIIAVGLEVMVLYVILVYTV